MSVALLFAGQGAQHPAMLPWLDDAALLARIGRRLGTTDWRTGLADPAWASSNRHAQVLLTATASAAWEQLAPDLPAPACVAGYSVGELAAFCAAGVFDASSAVDLAVSRAEAMDRCAALAPGAMIGVTGLDPAAIEPLCTVTGASIAIRNGIDSVVLGGTRRAIDAAGHAAAAAGARVTALPIGVASHTPLMRAAVTEFARTLAAVPVKRPAAILFTNTRGRVDDAGGATEALAEQIAATVRWDECMDAIHARRPACVLEIGPGDALSRMWAQRHPEVPARSCDAFRSRDAVVRWVSAQLSGR